MNRIRKGLAALIKVMLARPSGAWCYRLQILYSPGSRTCGPSQGSDPTETDTFRLLVVQDFDSVAVEDGDNGAGEVGRRYSDDYP